MKLFKLLFVSIIFFINCISCAENNAQELKNVSLEVDNTSLELISNVDMFDVGLAKINNDPNYDIYTINHVYAESILISRNGDFVESGLALGLSQTNKMPDYESTGRSPIIKKGLNIYSARRKQLILYCNECDKTINGTIKFPSPKGDENSVSLTHKEQAEVKKNYLITEKDKHVTSIDFILEANGLIVLNVTFMDINIEFKIEYPAQSIYLGESSISPKSNNFTVSSRDNHSFAWAKVTNDNYTDVFMATGGLRAKINKFHPQQVVKELFYANKTAKNNFVDDYASTGIKKGLCRTYRSEWVDFDQDGDLDLYLGCKNSPNLMQQQLGVGTGKFVEVAAKYGLDFKHGDEFRWVDWNNDKAIDIMLIQKNKLMIYENSINNNEISKFSKVKNSANLGKKLDSINSSIKTIDINNNGIPEIFVSTNKQIYYFEFDKEKGYLRRSLSKLNLPNNLSGNLNFVDVNLDGNLDLCVFNHGIFLQNPKHKFNKTDLLPELFMPRRYHFKNILWFDSDINGEWDVLNAESYMKPDKKVVQLFSYKYIDIRKWDSINLSRNVIKKQNNWLQVDLVGSEFNQDAIGAKIVVKNTKGLKQTRYNHGTNDSFHSQGHYRQYFGLGKSPTVNLSVIWPDGKILDLKDIKANQLLTVNYMQ